MPRRGAAASRNQFGLVNQVAGSGSPADSYRGESALSGAGYTGPSDFDGPFSHDPAKGLFPSYDAPATQGRGLSACSTPARSRMHNGTLWYALCGACWTFEPGSRRCKKCSMTPSPYAPKCANW